MCEVTIYLGKKNEGNIIMESSSRYEINFIDKKIVAYPVLGKGKELKFKSINRITWSEFDDSLIIDGKLEVRSR